MPPRKKARLPASATSTPSREVQTPVAATPVEADTPSQRDVAVSNFVLDAWTDEQETCLFKGMVRWKPAGMHKHFRMMAISQQLQNSGTVSKHESHTRIPGIWRKLGTLYNLEAIDERENSFLEPDDEYEEPAQEPFHAFTLPEAEYGEAMFARRLAPEGSSSPTVLDRAPPSTVKRGRRADRSISRIGMRASTVEDTEEEARSSPAPARGGRNKRGGARATPRARAAGRRESKAASVAEEEEATGEEADEEENEEEGEDDEDAQDDSTNVGSPAPRSRRNASKPGRGGGRRRQQQQQLKKGAGGADTRRSTRKK
ncbi:MAG: hypothetical protein M1832_001934 [Thelocarpon impressellum]|nr:MAG: hypothetical protein M1832_001934 [Thelocarpon impressellum]